MALVNQNLTLEIVPGAIPPTLHVTEYDENMQVEVQLLQMGQAFEIPSGTTAKVEGTLAGHPFSENATPSGDTVTFTVSKNMTAYSGRAWTKIKLTKDGKPVSTCGFWLDCDRAGVEAETVIGAPGFEEQIKQGVTDYIESNDMMTLNGDNGDAVIFLHYNESEESWDQTTPAPIAQKEMESGEQMFPVSTISAASAVSSVKFHRSGVNMLRSDKRVYNSSGRLDYYDTTEGLFLPAGTYTLFLNWVSSGYVSFYVFDYTNHGGSERLAYGTVSGGLTFTLTEAHFCSFRVYRDHDVPTDGQLGLCVGSSAPAEWAEYSGTEYTVTLPSAVTSGTINLKDKTLTVSGSSSAISDAPNIYALDGMNTVWSDYDTEIYLITQGTPASEFDVLSVKAIAPIVRKTFCGVEQSETANLVTVDAIESDDLVVSANVQTAPITLKVHHCGENFLDPSVKATANEVIQYHSADGGLYLPTGTYTLFLSDRSNTVSGLYVNQWVNGSVDSNALFAAYSATELHFTMTEGKYVRLRAYKSGGINQSMSLGLVRGSVTPTAFPSYQGEVVTDSASETGVKKITLAAFEGVNNVWQENGTVSIEQIPSYEQKVREYAETDAIQKQLSALRSCNPNFFSSAHRGGRFIVPECTEPAMVFAKQQGFTAAENDVNKTSDGVFVMYHDAMLDALGYPNVAVRDTTYANLLNYDFGSYVSSEFAGTKILTFEEWLGVCMKLGLRPIIDFKITPENDTDFAADVAALVAIVKKMGMLRKVTWLAYPAQIRAADSRADVYLMGAPYFNSTVNGYILDEDDPRFGFNVELSSLTTAMIETAHDHGVKISAWTNNAADVTESALVAQIEPFVNKGLEWITVNNYAVDKALIAKMIE